MARSGCQKKGVPQVWKDRGSGGLIRPAEAKRAVAAFAEVTEESAPTVTLDHSELGRGSRLNGAWIPKPDIVFVTRLS